MKVLYIAGYGRSGSTVLATILAGHPEIASVGELAYALDDWADPRRTCACGLHYRECGFWRDLVRSVPLDPDARRQVRRTERLASLPRLWLGLTGRAQRDTYRTLQRRIFDHIAARSGATIVLDSSKSARLAAGRPLALRRLLGYDVYVVHLVRNGFATTHSLVRTGSNWALEDHAPPPRLPALRAAVGWTWANLAAAAMKAAFGPDRYLRVRFEDFLADPAAALERIGAFAGADMTPVIQRLREGQDFSVPHMVGGNRVRFQGRIALHRDPGPAPSRALRRRERLLFRAIGGWLNRLYGYGN